MNKTSIEWTDFTWNPIRARNTRSRDKRTGTFCTRISPGCKNCYASVINRRFGTGDEYEVPNLAHHEFFIDERILYEPRHRKNARAGGRCEIEFHGKRCNRFASWDGIGHGELVHVRASAHGGSDSLENCLWGCGPCHRRKFHPGLQWTRNEVRA